MADPDENVRTVRRRQSARRGRRVTSRAAAGPARVALYVAAALALLVLLLVAVDAFASMARVHPGVSVAGVSVGGKTPAEAVAILKTELPAKAAVPVDVQYAAKRWTVKASDIDATFDYIALLDQAMAVGRSRDVVEFVGDRARAWVAGTNLPAPPRANAGKFDAAVNKIAADIDEAPRDASLSISAKEVSVKPSATGVAVDRNALRAGILGAFTAKTRAVAVRAVTAQPKISDAEGASAKTLVEKMIAAPVIVTFAARSWTLSRADLAKMVVAPAAEASGSRNWVLVPHVGAAEASKTIVPLVGRSLGSPPVDARFKTTNGAVVIVGSKDGVGPDVQEFASSLTSILKDESNGRTVALHSKITPARFTTAQARAMGIHERISTFTTTYDGGNAPRTNNIHTLGSALDGELVPPGGTFSFNKYVGERTAAKGYEVANAIVKGKLVPQLGGGICQVGTTMFNTVFFSGMPVIERSNHSFYISHYPKGRDATVSWGGPDLKWKNDTASWMLISVSYTSDSITISLYGTNPGYTVTYKTGDFTNVVPYSTQTVSDPALQNGIKLVQDPGIDGRTCVVNRTVTKGATVVRTDSFKSVYKPKDEVVQAGTSGKPSKTATSTAGAKH